MVDLTEIQREHLHEKLLNHWAQKQIDDKRGVCGPGHSLSESELAGLLRLTRAIPPVAVA